MSFRIKIDPLLLNYQRAVQNLRVNCANIFPYDTKEEEQDTTKEAEADH